MKAKELKKLLEDIEARLKKLEAQVKAIWKMKKEQGFFNFIEKASKIVLKEDEKLFKELGKS